MSFTREEAKKFANKAIDEIYDHNPKAFCLEIKASVNTIPTYNISYDGYAKISTYSPNEEEKGEYHD